MDENQTSSGDLSSAVAAISETAPKLSGLDKLRDTAEKKTFETPAPAAKPTADAKPVPIKPGTPTAPKPGEAPLPAAATAAPYTPDFKYKAGGKEMEIPEKFRALITDKESEEEVKKLFGQAATLDEFKGTTTTLKKNLAESNHALGQYQSGIAELRKLVQKGDFDTWFKKINIPEEKIFQWVLDKVQYNQLPPEQKAQLDRQRELQRQAEMAQEQVSQVSNREMQLATQMKGMQLDQTLGKADVKAMSDSFDSRVGRPGAFRDAIIEHGKSVWALSNGTVDLSPEEAVADFVKKYGNPSSFATPNPAAGAATPSANATPPVKVIPNVAGRSASVVQKQKPKSIDDLKRLRDAAVKDDNASRSPSQGYLAG